MARKLRIEYEGALYHVINRGNYRADIFASDGAKEAFEKCLAEVCAKTEWVIQAYVLMRNHYHLALETPKGNLVAGMKWLQATFANRFNSFRAERGHVFQGRYQAIVLEDADALGAVCHYIHLNPVRAHVVPVAELSGFRWASYHWLDQPGKRPQFLKVDAALEAAGALADTPTGRKQYQAYLEWLASDTAEQKVLGFERMSRGWAHGSTGFKKALAQGQKEVRQAGKVLEADAAEVRELAWEEAAQRCLRAIGEDAAEPTQTKKAAPWKIAVATHLKQHTTVTNPWLARRLHMGAPDGVSRYCTECRAGQRPEATLLLAKISDILV